jgi:Retinoic acid induced 16-like protein
MQTYIIIINIAIFWFPDRALYPSRAPVLSVCQKSTCSTPVCSGESRVFYLISYVCRLDLVSLAEDQQNFPGKRQLVSFLSWLDFCDQLITLAHPVVGCSLASNLSRRLLGECMEPAILQT